MLGQLFQGVLREFLSKFCAWEEHIDLALFRYCDCFTDVKSCHFYLLSLLTCWPKRTCLHGCAPSWIDINSLWSPFFVLLPHPLSINAHGRSDAEINNSLPPVLLIFLPSSSVKCQLMSFLFYCLDFSTAGDDFQLYLRHVARHDFFNTLGWNCPTFSCITNVEIIPQASSPYSCVLPVTKALSRVSRESFLFR